MAELQRNSGKEPAITGTRNQYVALILGIALVAPGFASDLGKEQRWREQVADSIMDGEEVDVMADGLGVFGIYTEATNDSEKGIIVVHGTGIHPVTLPRDRAMPPGRSSCRC